jgi:hypothetical protein
MGKLTLQKKFTDGLNVLDEVIDLGQEGNENKFPNQALCSQWPQPLF